MNKRKSVEEEDCQKSLCSGSTNGGTVLPSKYKFCDKASKYKKGSKTLEKMKCCAEQCADERIWQIATVKHDSKIISINSDELVAKEAKYHSSCYKDYAHPEKQLAGNNDTVKADILKTVVKQLLQKSDDKIVYLSKVKTKHMLYLENDDIDFKNAGKNLKHSIKRNLSNINY